ncbi:MAG: ImmA/IrrE family metallo-endopeptidase [Prevotellaceae bacterium]|nr:ImmA/IrrE family metallo-endopeptidase [Prevotellaceae bacterium]
MKKLTSDSAEFLALQMRNRLGIGANEPVNLKTVIRQLNIMAVYRPLSERFFGLSLKSSGGENMFMLINSNSTRGRQHFTIAHELFHLVYDENPKAHFSGQEADKDPAERSANLFASAFLMPCKGVVGKIPAKEIAARRVSIETAIRLGQLYGVSHSTLVLRLKELKIIPELYAKRLLSVSIQREAALRGFDLSLYNPGNQGLVIGDFGTNARKLYDDEKISEGHYMELLNMIGMVKTKIVLDADVLIHFSKAGRLSLLPDILPQYEFVVLSVVYEEIESIHQQLDNQIHFLKNIKKEPFLPTGEMRKEYAMLRSRFGKGESACLAYCRYTDNVIGSSNLKNIKKYCSAHQIAYLTSIDFLYYAYIKGKMTAKECTEFIETVNKKGSKLPILDITAYVPNTHV